MDPADASKNSRLAPAPEDVADRLHSAAIHLLRRLRVNDDASGLTAPRMSALSVLVFGGPLTVGSLAAAEQVRVPTMTRLVQALAADGLVSCEVDAADRRRVIVRATAAGTRILRRGRVRRVRALALRLAAVSAADLHSLDRAATVLESLDWRTQ